LLNAVCAARSLHTFGYDWLVRSSGGTKSGPGPNVFSDSRASAYVGDDGALHLAQHRSTAAGALRTDFDCAEVTLGSALGYGMYDFSSDRALDALGRADPHVVLGLFLYKDDAHELDIEFARWGAGASASKLNADYVNQPNTGASKALLWTQPAGLGATTHRIDFQPGLVQWSSFSTADGPTKPYVHFVSTDKVPAADGMLVHVNLWCVALAARCFAAPPAPAPRANHTPAPAHTHPPRVRRMFRGASNLTQDTLDVSISNFTFTAH